jgi:DNA-3-methyladenine glycosylase
MHYCCNVVTGQEGDGSAVLIRAVEPITNEAYMAARRNKSGIDVTNGPAKLCQALGIDRGMNGHDLRRSPLVLRHDADIPKSDIITTTRVGISKGKDEQRRFYIKNNPYVSVQAR